MNEELFSMNKISIKRKFLLLYLSIFIIIFIIIIIDKNYYKIYLILMN